MSFTPSVGNANINVTFPSLFGGWQVLVHRRLPLQAQTKYRISFMINTYAASLTDGLRVVLRKDGQEEATRTITVAPGSGWQLVSFDFNTRSASPELAFIVQGTLNAAIYSLSVIRDDAIMDFDSADKRWSWRNDNTARRALIFPDGAGDDIRPNWAALARPDTSRAPGTDFPVANRHLALIPNTTYKICFDVRREGPPAVGDFPQRLVRIVSDGSVVLSMGFQPTEGWMTVCSEDLRLPSQDNNLQFGFGRPDVVGGYFIDNVRILRQPCGSVESGCTSRESCVDGQCVCVPWPDPCALFGRTCGFAEDGCGGRVLCGVCPGTMVCRDYQCVRPQCCVGGCVRPRICDPEACACVFPQ